MEVKDKLVTLEDLKLANDNLNTKISTINTDISTINGQINTINSNLIQLNSDIHVEVFKVTTGSDRFVSFFYGDVDIKKYCDIYGKPISAIIFETQENSCILTYIHGTYIRILSLYENLTGSVRVTFKKIE